MFTEVTMQTRYERLIKSQFHKLGKDKLREIERSEGPHHLCEYHNKYRS